MDLAIIGTAFSHLKTSMDIAKLISDSTSSLADLKMELADIKVNLIDKDEMIRELNEIIKEEESLSFDGQLYWKEKDKTPFCPVCKEKDEKNIHLTFFENGSGYYGQDYSCKVCEKHFFL